MLGRPVDDPAAPTLWVLETNVDDLDPRVWPTALAALLDAGAADAWLVPIVMKKGRPAHTLCVLAREPDREPLRAMVFALTGTLGVREAPVHRTALERDWRPVALAGGEVRVKVGLHAGRIAVVTPEFEDAAALGRARGVPVRHVLDEGGRRGRGGRAATPAPPGPLRRTTVSPGRRSGRPGGRRRSRCRC